MTPRTIIALQVPRGISLSAALPYLQRTGALELQGTRVMYLDVGVSRKPRLLRRRLIVLRATMQSLLSAPIRIGVASTKSVSLIAARTSPPGGITIVPGGKELTFLDRIAIDVLPGIGRRTATYLRHRGVTTIGKFSRLPQVAMVQLFGVSGIVLHEFSRGSDPRDVIPLQYKTPRPLERRSLFSLFKSSPPYSTLGVGAGVSSG